MGTFKVGSGGDFTNLQDALTAASYGDIFLIDPQFPLVAQQSFFLPKPKGDVRNGYVTVQSAALAQLPAADPNNPHSGRVKPALSPYLAHVLIPTALYMSGNAILYAQPGANYWHFLGVEFTMSDQVVTNQVGYWLIRVDGTNGGTTPVQSLAQAPDHLWFDQCLIHAPDSCMAQEGIFGQYCGQLDVTNSYIYNIRGANQGSMGANPECHGLAIVAGPGPVNVMNNYVEATGQSMIFGGQGAPYGGFYPIPTGKIQYNTLTKNPNWNTNSPNYIQPPGGASNWVCKNVLEFKTGHNFLIDHNLLQYSWAGQQRGDGLVFNLTNYSGSGIEQISGIQFTNNCIDSVAIPLTLAIAGDPVKPSAGQMLRGCTFQNNQCTNIGWPWMTSAGGYEATPQSVFLSQSDGMTIDHNTFIPVTSMREAVQLDTYGPSWATNLKLTNNIWAEGTYGYACNDLHGAFVPNNRTVLDQVAPAAQVAGNILIGNGQAPANVYNDLPAATMAEVGFDNSQNLSFEGSNGSMVSIPVYVLGASSPFKGKGTDGKDPGFAPGATTPPPPPPPPPPPARIFTALNLTAPSMMKTGDIQVANVQVTTTDGSIPTGLVSLNFGNGIATHSLTNGSTSFQLKTLPAGTYPLQAVYDTQGAFLGSSSAVQNLVVSGSPPPPPQTVPTSLSLQAPMSMNQGDMSQNAVVTLKTADGTVPSGTIQLSINNTSVFRALTNGSATFQLGSLAVGTYILQAVYAANGNYASSSSAKTALQVGAVAPPPPPPGQTTVVVTGAALAPGTYVLTKTAG